MKYLIRMWLLLILLFMSLFSHADNTDNNVLSRLEVDLISLINPLGISLSANGFYRQVYRHDESPLWDGLYYQTGLQANLNPAFARAGIHLEWLPVAILKLRLQYDRFYFSGSNGSLLSFASADDLFGDDELLAREGEEVSGYGDRALFQFEFRAKLNNMIIRNITGLVYYRFPGDGPYYLEREYEILMATSDDVVSNQTFLLFENKNEKGSSFIGPYHDYVHVRKSNLTRERLGVTWYQEYTASVGAVQEPHWFIQSGIYLNERNREDEFYLVAGVGGYFN
ncbi:MAG: hypothetical protein KAU21_17050 [Gammaproteobacteria bacterium]|nr:hypothetical protein [Gammaproteobacteria bacterium]